jgi:hypothetical protein
LVEIHSNQVDIIITNLEQVVETLDTQNHNIK